MVHDIKTGREISSAGIVANIRKTSFLPLRDAVLCSDCSFVSANEEGVCPVCRGRSLERLADRLHAAEQAHDGRRQHGFRGFLQVLGLRGLRRGNRRRDFAYLER